MKIGNRSSVLGTGIWKISDMSEVRQLRNTTQTQSTAITLTEAQRNQQLNEFKSQEQLLRANLHQQFRANDLAGVNLNKRMTAEFADNPEANAVRAELIQAEMDRLKRIIDSARSNSRLGPGSVERDTYRQNLINRYQNEIENLQTQYQKLRESQNTFDDQLTDIANGQFPKTHSEFGNRIAGSASGEGAPSGPEQSQPQTEVQRRATTLSLSINNPYSHGWRRPSSNGVLNNRQSSGQSQVNQKGDGAGNQNDYSAGTNSSNDAHASRSDNRSYSKPEPEKPSNDGYENNTHDDQTGIDIVSPEGYAPGEYPTSFSGDDPITGHGNGSGNDIGASGRIPKGSPDNRSGIQQMVQPAINLFSTTTGADDEEHPNTGNAQGTIWNPTEGNDLGDDLPYDLSRSGGSIDIEAGKVLLEKIRPMNPGGPDPTKLK